METSHDTSGTMGDRVLGLLVGDDADARAPIFGVPGGQTLPLYASAAASGACHVLVRDERNAACAADAYARVTGRVGLCDATVGPGATNLVSGLAEAHASSVPVIAVVADIRRDVEHLRRRSVVSQAVDQAALLAPVSKWVARVQTPDSVDEVIDQAFRVATTGRPGPVVVEIPEDIFLGTRGEGRHRTITDADRRYPRFRSHPGPVDVDRIASLITGASRPVVLAGGGTVWSGASHAIERLATNHGLPVVTTLNGKGAIDERHPLAAGVVGGFGSVRGNLCVTSADVVVAIGTKFDQLSSHVWRLPRPDQTVVHVDVDGEEIGRAIAVTVGVVADAAAFADALDRALGPWSATTTWIDEIAPSPPESTVRDDRIDPVDVVTALDDLLGPDDLLVCDASLSSGWAAAHFRVKTSGVGMLAPRGLAGLGWAPGAVLGARLGRPTGKVVMLTGDGAWGYGMGELETSTRLGLDITYVVLNNAALGWIRHAEDAMKLRSRSVFGEVDFAASARGLGADACVVRAGDDVHAMLAVALERGAPSLVDVRSSATASPVVRFGSVRTSPYL
ncbi:MAG: thiamine pyrophosphate-binding protein [Ilumatobacteraceae bacterium]